MAGPIKHPSLRSKARAIFSDQGEDGLIFAPAPNVKGEGTDKSMRAIAAEFLFGASDVTTWWVLSHKFDAELRYRRGTVWTVDMGTVAMVAGIAETANQGAKRALALSAVARTHWSNWRGLLQRRLLEDPDPRVRAMAASLLPPAKGESIRKALPLVNAMTGLLGLESSDVRAAAVRGLARYAHRAEDIALINRIARSDKDPEVRIAATLALATIPSLAARERLIAIARDLAQPEPVRGAAKKALRQGFVVPDDLCQ